MYTVTAKYNYSIVKAGAYSRGRGKYEKVIRKS